MLHLTLQGKGGVGKSLVATLLAQHRQHHGAPLLGLDTDPTNGTFVAHKGLPVQAHRLLDEHNRLDERQYDALIELLLERGRDHEIVVDTGATTFLSLTSYMMENEAFTVLAGEGLPVVLHVVVVGGQAMVDTLGGLANLAGQLPPDQVRIVVWLNEFFGAIEADGKTFEEMKVYKDHSERLYGLITLARRASLFDSDMRSLLERRKTFKEALSGTDFGLMNRRRLAIVWDDIRRQLDAVLPVEAAADG